MTHYIPAINAFIEDTCVLVVIAYLLARGGALAILFPARPSARNDALLGVLLGFVGLTEIIFPGARSPYIVHSLIITFATLIGGLRVGFIAAGAVTLIAGALRTPPGVWETALTLFGSAIIAECGRRLFGRRATLLRNFTAGAASAAGGGLLHQISTGLGHLPHLPRFILLSSAANGFGVLLLQLILNDARARADSERNRLEAERAHALAGEAQLAALRARIHPHFLFNALTSIAALCSIAPDKAEAAILRLSQLMRGVLAAHPSAPIPLAQEIEYARGFLEIEQHRLGTRLRVAWEIDPAAETVLIPTFAIQTLVENAVLHGVAPKMEPGEIQIIVRILPDYALIAVTDDGEGISEGGRRAALQNEGTPSNGLKITGQQLFLLYGNRARLRLFRRKSGGTLAAFAIPLPGAALSRSAAKRPGLFPQEKTDHAERAYRG